MKYTFQIVDVFSSTPFGGNQLAVLPDAAGISTEGMQKIAREFNFGETTFVLPNNDPANTCRVRIFTPRAELDFAGHPSVGTACALVMKQHVRLSAPIRLILEENGAPARRPFSPWCRRRPIDRARRGEPSLFRGRRCSILFCATELERGRRSGGDQSGCLGGNARASVGYPRVLLRRKSTGWRQALCSHVGTRAGRR